MLIHPPPVHCAPTKDERTGGGIISNNYRVYTKINKMPADICVTRPDLRVNSVATNSASQVYSKHYLNKTIHLRVSENGWFVTKQDRSSSMN